ncbi:MAG: hypothetical protein MJ048_03965 [Acidaminococcaceae bacterium]|nr:hypothetical protein [Acidaminococcaceae bacterium]
MWFILALIAVIGWGVEDVFVRAGTNNQDQLNQYRMGVISGFFFLAIGVLAAPWASGWGELFNLVVANPILLMVPVLYVTTLILSYTGFRYLEAGIMAPLKNASGCFSTIMFLLWYAYIGKIEAVWEQISVIDIISTVLIVVGILALGYVEEYYKRSRQNTLGFLAFVFPLIFCFADTLDTVICGIMLSDDVEIGIGPVDYFRLYSLCFAVEGLISWIYVSYKEHKPYNFLSNVNFNYMMGGFLEAAGLLAYTIAMEIEPVYVAVIITPYCVFTELTAYFWLKERFTKGQYLCFTIIILGIILMGCQELF